MIIFLIGMPACGKTSLGKRLAKRISFNFLDLDKHLVLKENRSIPAIFSDEGEIVFRELEAKYLREISDNSADTVVAVGGGTPCYHNNVERMLSTGKVIYLNTSVDTLFLRLKDDIKRPLFAGLTDDAVKNKLHVLLGEREVFYLQAHYTINTSHKSDGAIVEEIALIIGPKA